MNTWGGQDPEPADDGQPPKSRPGRKTGFWWTAGLIALVVGVLIYGILTMIYGPAQSSSTPATSSSQPPNLGGASGDAGPIVEGPGYAHTSSDPCNPVVANVKLRIQWPTAENKPTPLGIMFQAYRFGDNGLPLAVWDQASVTWKDQDGGFSWKLDGVQLTGAVVYSWSAAVPTLYRQFGDGIVKLTSASWPPREIQICGRAITAD
ncbi:MAG TPA: hypothetical protein VLI05_00580 [Candidatus Saccharimonadia bacterium]|nr:hypothetical protein [Candidatus Saccharimonadia bacterium]